MESMNFMSGKLYLIEERLVGKSSFKDTKKNHLEVFELHRGVVLPNKQHDNERLKFDILQNDEYYGGYVTGFLYPNGTMLGKLHWNAEGGFEADRLSGNYKKTKAGIIHLHGVWEENN